MVNQSQGELLQTTCIHPLKWQLSEHLLCTASFRVLWHPIGWAGPQLMDSPWLLIVSFFHIHTEWAASFVLAVVTWSPGAGDHSWPLYSAGMLHTSLLLRSFGGYLCPLQYHL